MRPFDGFAGDVLHNVVAARQGDGGSHAERRGLRLAAYRPGRGTFVMLHMYAASERL